MPQLFDAVTLGDTRITRSGYLVADAKISRTGIQTYLGRELGRPELGIVRVFRSEEEVFSAESLSSFAYAPVTDEHPPELLSSKNWKTYSRGQTGGEVLRDGQFVRVPMMISDQTTIDAIQLGKRELSAGYTCDVDFTAGVTPDGENYDAIMTAIRGNHLAIVSKGRAGSECRVGDKETGVNNLMTTILIDGVNVETTEEGAAAISLMQSALTEAVESLSVADAALASALAASIASVSAKDGEIDALRAAHTAEMMSRTAELATANSRIMDTAAIDAAISARMAVIDAARAILGATFDVAGKSDADLRRAAVALRLGDAKLVGKDDAYIVAAFDTLTAVSVVSDVDPLRSAIISNSPPKPALSAYEKHVAWLADAHKSTGKDV